MKRLIAATLVLVLLSAGALAAVASSVNKSKDTLTYTESVLYGDPSIIEGAVVSGVLHYQNRLVWNTSYRFGIGTESSFKYHFTKHYANGKPLLPGFILGNDIGMGFDYRKPASEQSGISKIYKELYDSLDYGEQGEMTVRLADVYEYYPLRININLPKVSWSANTEHGIRIGNVGTPEEHEADQRIYDDICEFFKIPMLDSEYVDITVNKHNSGSVGFGHGLSDKNKDTFSIQSRSAYTDGVCYIALNNRTEQGSIMDFGNIPGGYGIYALPYGYRTIKTDELSTVYKLDDKAQINHLAVSDDQSKLLITLYEDGISYLEVVDIKSMTRLQKLPIAEGAHGIVLPRDGFTVYVFNNHIAVITESEGIYSLALIAEKFPANTDTDFFSVRSATALDFDGERLVMVDNTYFANEWVEKCGFYAAVYTSDGLRYFGKYTSSLDANFGASTKYTFNCATLTPFSVKLK